MTGQRRGFAGDALHQIAVAANRVDVVVEQRETRPVVMRAEQARRDRHADAVAAALAERPGRGLDAGGVAVFRMAGRDAVELAEILDVVEAHRRTIGDALPVDAPHLGQVQQRIEQHRGVAGRQHEAVAVGPQRIGRVVAQKLLPQRIGDRRDPHRRAGMAGLRLLHGVDGQRADGVDAQPVDVLMRIGRGTGARMGGCSLSGHDLALTGQGIQKSPGEGTIEAPKPFHATARQSPIGAATYCALAFRIAVHTV